ncbi:hypothetical protein DUNSADRAFT_9777 [Dunaliella salina]|uniref:Encoded protein n=1 Tax=Dunaliella salina TaxID=3046 RepID=A0ABQ7GGQ6_DUNSA|nr:hypothetical protein DUNSADRAFT_9777 [Dunaliella salina]|eukprot:KAF5833792.1 hypothetical protein DUNSADRAFT_9777 [Dunaliella salina]
MSWQLCSCALLVPQVIVCSCIKPARTLLFAQVIIPYFQKPASSEDGQMSEAMRKKLEKTEKRAERRRQKRF